MEVKQEVEAENNEGVQERGGEMRQVKRELKVKREMWIGYMIGAVEVTARRSIMMRITEIKRGPYDIKQSGQDLEIWGKRNSAEDRDGPSRRVTQVVTSADEGLIAYVLPFNPATSPLSVPNVFFSFGVLGAMLTPPPDELTLLGVLAPLAGVANPILASLDALFWCCAADADDGDIVPDPGLEPALEPPV
jgi:hypothetical protein